MERNEIEFDEKRLTQKERAQVFRWLRSGLAAVVLLLWIAPAQALAYSYGDANTEDVAETFKLIEASLSGTSPNWQAAADAHKVRRSEIKAHFGDAVAVTLDKNVEAKDGKLLVANYKAVLVMNLDRRFTYAIKDVEDYAAAKLLLAKAKATFDVMAPYVSSGTDGINQAFEDALEALGNPGLFGVGKKEVDPQAFKEKVNFIYSKVKPLFPYKAYVKPSSPTQEKPSTEPKPSAKPDTKPVEKPETKPAPDKKPVSEAGEPSPSATPSASESPSLEPEEQPSATAEATESVTASESPSASPSESVSPESEPAASAESSESAQPEPSESAAADDGEIAQAASEEHAPMDRSDKTNTKVTVIVIAGVILVGGGALWFIRKKGLI